MGRAAKIYDFSMAAGGVSVILANGGYYKILSSLGAVEVTRGGGSRVQLQAGQGEREEFTRLTIKDASGALNSGLVLVGEGSFIDDRVSGEVSVISGERARVLSGVSFYAAVYAAANPGFFSHAQLVNPSGSGKNLMVEQVTLEAPGTATPINFSLRSHGLAFATAAPAPVNKKMGGPASSAICRIDNSTSAAMLGSGMGAQFPASQSTPFVHSPKGGPICIPQGFTLVVVPTAANQECFPFFEFYEELV